MSTPFTEALSQLNDRALRRLLGARAFLRGYDYVRRQAVHDVQMAEISAKGAVRGTEPDPYAVKLQVTPTGFTSECTCPAFPKINGHCKHVAALLIALRDQVRPKQARPEPQQNGVSAVAHGGGAGELEAVAGGSRRARRRARKLAAQRALAAGGGGALGPARPGFTIEGSGRATTG
ncbi:MAG TPA: SWIM zinc finger family protein, partial [Labilithrix sp.]|nr:SWIM zinc finger family protein [Labilithrix sp.]